jgi:chromate reductase, NAD(P)H dehydrogenase (quinone)
MQVLALSGSLRAASINTALLRAAARLAPPGLMVQVFGGIGDLPLFNIDLEQAVPAPVVALREAVAGADALLIASPEYAHGVSGVMKNTLDWLVSLESFVGKPVALINAQPRAQFSDPALREILTTMSADLVLPASVSLALTSDTLTEAGMLASESVCAALSAAMAALYSRHSQPIPHVHAVYPLDGVSAGFSRVTSQAEGT